MSYQNYSMMGMSGTNAPVAALTNFASQQQSQQQAQAPSQHQQQFNTNSQQQMQQQQQQRMMMQQMQMRRPYPDSNYGVNANYSVNNSNPNQQQSMSVNAYANMQQSNMSAQYANGNNNAAPNQMQSYQSNPSLPYSSMSMLNDPFRSSGGPSAGINPNLLAVNTNINAANANSMSIALANTVSNIDPLTGRRRSVASFSPLPGSYSSNPSTPSDVVNNGLGGGTGSRRASIVEFPQPIRPATLAANYPLVTPAAAVAANTYLPSPSKPPPMNFTSTAHNGNGALATPLATRLTPSLTMSASHPSAHTYSSDGSNHNNGTDILAAATVVAANSPAATKPTKSSLVLNNPLVTATIATATTVTPTSKTAKVSPAPILTKQSPRPTTSAKSNSNKKSTTPSPSPPPVASPSSAGTPRSQQSNATSKGGKNPSATPSPPTPSASSGKKPAKPRSKPPSCAPNAEELPPGFKKQACTVCHHAKTSCDGRRPCFRCIRLNKTALCEDRQRKEHLKKKSPPRNSPSQSARSAGKKGGTPTASQRTTASSTSSRSKRKRAAESEEEEDDEEEEDEEDEEQEEDAEMEDEEEQGEEGEDEEEEVQDGDEAEAEADHSHEDGEGHDHEAEEEGEDDDAAADDESEDGEAAATGPTIIISKSTESNNKAKEGGGKVAAPVALVTAVAARSVQMSDGALPLPTSESIPIPIPTSSLPIPVTPNHDGAAADTASLISDVTAGMPSNPYISRYMRRRSSTLEGLAASSYLNAGTDAYGGSLARVGGELRSAMVSPSSFIANRRDSLAGGLGFIGSGSLLMNSHGFTPMSPMSIVERTIQSQPLADPSMDHMLSYTGTDESGAPLSGASSSLPHHPVVLPMDSAASHHLLMGRRRSSIGAPLHLGLFTPNVPGSLLGAPPGPLGPPGSLTTTLPPRVPGSLAYYPSPAGSMGVPSPNFLAPPIAGLAPAIVPTVAPVASTIPIIPQSASALESAAAAAAAAGSNSSLPLPSAFLSGKERLSKSLMASYRSIDVRSKIKEKLEAILREKEQEVPTSADSAAVNKLVVGRLQFYLLQLSELMQEDDWNELVDELPIQVFTSQSARYISPPPQARKMSKSEITTSSDDSVPPITIAATTTTPTVATVPTVSTPDSSVVPSSRKSSVSSASNISYNYPYGSQCKVSWFESPVLCMEEDDAALVREVRLRRLMKKNLAEGIPNPESMDADLKALMAGNLQTGPSPSEVDANSSSVAIMKLQPLSVFRAMKRAQRRAHRVRGASKRSSSVPAGPGSASVDPSDISAVDHARRVQRRLRKKEKKRAKKLVRREKRKQKQAERKKRKAEKKARRVEARAAKKLKTVGADGVPVAVKVEPLESDSDVDVSSSSDFSSSSSSSSCSSASELSSDYSDTDDEDLGGEPAAFSASASNPAAAAFNGWLPVRLEKHQVNCKVFLAQRAAAREARRKKKAEAKGGVAAANLTNPAVLSTMSPMSDGNPTSSTANNASSGSTPNPATSASDSKCSCVPSLHLPMIVHVNREWERLFGWTQREIRTLMMREGIRGLGRVTRLDAFTTAHKHIFEAILSGASDYRCYATIINKWQCSIPCMAHTRVELSDMDGCFQGYVNTWTPLPQTTQAAE